MLQEHQLVPYQTSPLPGGPWLVFAPHPDDETFGMGGSLLLASRQRIVIDLVVVTNGALGGEPGMELAALRERETLKAADRLGIREVRFWRQPDRGLQVTSPLIGKVARLIEHISPASVFFPSPMELHPDHRTTSTLVWEGLRQADFRGNAWAYEISVQGRINRLVDITSVIEEKKMAMQAYPSQLTENDYMGVVLALDKARTYTLARGVSYAEGFYVYGNRDTELAQQTRLSLELYWQSQGKAASPENNQTQQPRERELAQSQLNQVTHQLTRTRERLHESMKKLRQADIRMTHLSEQLRSIENSTSWRLTRPLRTTIVRMRALRRMGSLTLKKLKHYAVTVKNLTKSN